MNTVSSPSINSELILDTGLQKQLFQELVEKFAALSMVSAIIQRGSLAKQADDRASDVDLLLVIEDDFFEQFINDIDTYIHSFTKCLTKNGWIDSIVPNFGGIGFVFLVEYKNQLIQLDVYVTPASNSKKIFDFSEKVVKYVKPEFNPPTNQPDLSNHAFTTFIHKHAYQADKEFQIIFECILMIEMYVKHIYRGRVTLACKYRYGAIESLAVFLRLLFTPDRIEYKMYDWEKDFSLISSPIVKLYERSIQNIDIFSQDEALVLLKIFKVALFEGRLNKKFVEFSPLINELERYIHNLLNPIYLVKNE
jgi:hypothetical protein